MTRPAATPDAGAPPALSAGLPDALEVWTRFSLPPLSLEIPLTWYPQVSAWTARTARARCETLTGTPLEMNWAWFPLAAPDDPERARKRLDGAWRRESAAAEAQARKIKVPFQWRGAAQEFARYSGLEADGFAREYEWNGQAGCLAAFTLAAAGRRVYVSIALCPPLSSARPAREMRRVLRTFELAPAGAPLRLALAGLVAELPGEFELDGVRGKEGQLFVDAVSPEQKVNLARLAFADLHLAGKNPELFWSGLAKTLFDRGEAEDPLTGSLRQPLRAKVEREEPLALELHGHGAAVYRERRRVHIRCGDRVLRLLGRRWSGGAAALAWTCDRTRAIHAVGARCGEADALLAARDFAARVLCHTHPSQAGVDWRAFVAAEAPASGKPPEKMESSSPLDQRRRQLCFRVRVRPEVRLERSARDQGGRLYYPAAHAQGLVANLLRGQADPAPAIRTLDLDPVGRRAWELLAGAPSASVGELLAALSAEFMVHPVEFFPKLLLFLRLLGERRLVESAAAGEAGAAAAPEPAR